MTYNITTFGCQMNISDSERIASVMNEMGLKNADQNKADFLIFNLCSVRQTALDRVWGMLRKTKDKTVILTGCILPKDKKKFSEKKYLILDIKDLPNWPQKIQDLKKIKIKKTKNYFSISPTYKSKFSACVPIMTGCNNFCTYCAVPFTRGREYSRPAEEILCEVNKLIVRGVKEIILLGQNVNSYHDQQKTKKINFVQLLKKIDKIPGNYWLSFLTSHPKDMSDELIACFKTCQHLVPYLHLPLQSGSNKILKMMNRKYTFVHYEKLIKKIRKKNITNLHLTLSTDIITGFPGETKKDFLATKKAMEKIKFDMAYLAAYSPRPQTAAAKMKDNISKQEKEQRKNILNEVLKKTALENNKKMLGQETQVLVDKITDPTIAFGKTKNFKRIKIINKDKKINKKMLGNFVKVKITKANVWNLEGEII